MTIRNETGLAFDTEVFDDDGNKMDLCITTIDLKFRPGELIQADISVIQNKVNIDITRENLHLYANEDLDIVIEMIETGALNNAIDYLKNLQEKEISF